METADKRLRVIYYLALAIWLVVSIVASFNSGHSLAYHIGVFMFFATLPVSINQIIGIIVNDEIWGNTMLYLTMIIVAIIGLFLCQKSFILAAGGRFWIICVAVYFIPFLLRLAWRTTKSGK